jgi:predicted RNA-binding protein with PUA-like domain
MAGRWLLKTEPSSYSFADLERERQTVWDGVRNALACKNLQRIGKGDRLLIYHTGKVKAVVGIAVATSAAYPERAGERLPVVDVACVRALPHPVTLAQIKKTPRLADWDLVRLPRLSVMPVSAAQWGEIERLAK